MSKPRCPNCGDCKWELEAQRTTTESAEYVDGELLIAETDQTTHTMSLACNNCGEFVESGTWLASQVMELFV